MVVFAFCVDLLALGELGMQYLGRQGKSIRTYGGRGTQRLAKEHRVQQVGAQHVQRHR